MVDGPLDKDIVLSTIGILHEDKKQTKEEEKKRSTWVRPWLTRREERGFYHQIPMEISLAKYSLVTSQARAKSCRVASHGRLSRRFCRENFNSGDFFLAIFSSVASPVRGWLHVRFSSRAGDATKF